MGNCLDNIIVELEGESKNIFDAFYKIVNGNISVYFQKKDEATFDEEITIEGTVYYGETEKQCSFPFSATVSPQPSICDLFEDPKVICYNNPLFTFNPSIRIEENQCNLFNPSVIIEEDPCNLFNPSIIFVENECNLFNPTIIYDGSVEDCCSCNGVTLFEKN